MNQWNRRLRGIESAQHVSLCGQPADQREQSQLNAAYDTARRSRGGPACASSASGSRCLRIAGRPLVGGRAQIVQKARYLHGLRSRRTRKLPYALSAMTTRGQKDICGIRFRPAPAQELKFSR